MSQFNTPAPCRNCPFLRKGGVRLHKSRVIEIGGMMLSPQGGAFPCHKHTQHDDEGEFIPTGDEPHCAGALIFAEKNDTATQVMRIAERIGIYDRRKLMANRKAVAAVFDDLDEMLKINREEQAAQ